MMSSYLVIAPRSEQATLAPLLELRRQQGLEVTFVAAEDVLLAQGLVAKTRPDYVLLFGDEYEIPSLYGNDNGIADLDGDKIPDVAVGRIPAYGAAAKAVVDKLIRYETGPGGEWQTRAIFADGDPRFGRALDWGSNAMVNARGEQASPAVGFERVSWNREAGDVSGASKRASELLSAGVFYLGYNGHGSPSWTDVLSVRDLETLPSTAGYPIVLFAACYTGKYLAPSVVVDGPAVGAVGALDVTGTVNPALSETFAREITEGPALTLGAAFVRTKQQLATGDVPASPGWLLVLGDALGPAELSTARMLDSYQLYGDPATQLRRPTPIAVSGPSHVVAGEPFSISLDVPQALRSATVSVYLEHVMREPGDRLVAKQYLTLEDGALASMIVLPKGTPAGTYHLRIVVQKGGIVGSGAAAFVQVDAAPAPER
jgi:hypothetical protein